MFWNYKKALSYTAADVTCGPDFGSMKYKLLLSCEAHQANTKLDMGSMRLYFALWSILLYSMILKIAETNRLISR